MEFRRRYEGIFTKPIPTAKCSLATGAGPFVETGASTKWRVETVTGLKRHPVRSVAVTAIKTNLKPAFMAVP
jgi:hypothetical protein